MMPPNAIPGPIIFRGGTDEQVRTGDPMSPLQKIELAFRNFANFRGRASRSEFWWFALFNMIASVVVGFVDLSLGTGGGFNALYSIILIIPSISVGVRRLHDIDRTGWWYLLVFTIIGSFVLLFWAVQPGDPQPNRFSAGR